MQITLSADHRDALYDLALDRLSGLGDVWLLIERQEYEIAGRLGRELSDDLRLILDDLGWGDATGPVTLSLPPADLQRIFARFREHARGERAVLEQERAEERRFEERIDLVTAACEQVLTAIADAGER